MAVAEKDQIINQGITHRPSPNGGDGYTEENFVIEHRKGCSPLARTLGVLFCGGAAGGLLIVASNNIPAVSQFLTNAVKFFTP